MVNRGMRVWCWGLGYEGGMVGRARTIQEPVRESPTLGSLMLYTHLYILLDYCP